MAGPMKRIILAGAITLTTFVVGILAVSVAQKDSQSTPIALEQTPNYSKKSSKPILPVFKSGDSTSGDLSPPVVRGNDDLPIGEQPQMATLGNPMQPPIVGGPIGNEPPLAALRGPESAGFSAHQPYVGSVGDDLPPQESESSPNQLDSFPPVQPASALSSPQQVLAAPESPSAVSVQNRDANPNKLLGMPGVSDVRPGPEPAPGALQIPAFPMTQPTSSPKQPTSLSGGLGAPTAGLMSAPNRLASDNDGGALSPPTNAPSSPPNVDAALAPPSIRSVGPSDSNQPNPYSQNPVQAGTPPFQGATPNSFIASDTTQSEFARPTQNRMVSAGSPSVNRESSPADPSMRPLVDESQSLNSRTGVLADSAVQTSGLRGSGNSPMARLAQGTPGSRGLDGIQSPVFEIVKKAPEEIQVGVPAMFTVIVRNVGNATGHEVFVDDMVPQGTRLSQTMPEAEIDASGRVTWYLGEMPAGAERSLTMELVASTVGEIGSVASIRFSSLASARTVSTQPILEVTQSADPIVLIGQTAKLRISINNTGSGVARDIELMADIPSGFRHPSGNEIGAPIGDLRPGEGRTVDLDLIAAEPGMNQCLVRAVAKNLEPVQSNIAIEVTAPKLLVTTSGPARRFLERQAIYEVTVSNQGTAMARNIDLVSYLPRGLQYLQSENHGSYLQEQHAVAWSLDELQPGTSATTKLAVLPVQEGEFVLRMQAQAEGVRAEPTEKKVLVEGQSELYFTVEDDNDPIELDGLTTYTIRLANIGTRVDHNVELMIEMPAGSELQDVAAPVRYRVEGNGIRFEPISEMRAKDEKIIQFTLSMPSEGTQVLRAFVRSKLRPVEVVKEESTQVYRDQ